MGESLWVPLFAALAGGVGAALRFMLDGAITSRLVRRMRGAGFPGGIWVVNLSGSLAIGLVLGLFGAGHAATMVLGVGLLGGYTTFSTASYSTVQMLRRGRMAAAVANGLGQLLLAVVCSGLGLFVGVWFAQLVNAG